MIKTGLIEPPSIKNAAANGYAVFTQEIGRDTLKSFTMLLNMLLSQSVPH